MKVKDKEFEVFISEEELGTIVDRLACRISDDYAGKRPVVCPVLTGAYLFAADLLRKLTVEAEVAFVKYSSYEGMRSTGKVSCQLPFPESVRGRDVIIVEDIVDSGLSMEHLLQEVGRLEPRSVRICSLFFKPAAFKGHFQVDYVGKEIGNEFIVGYGLDYDEEGRTLKEVYVVKGDSRQ